jgi:hypothetical protein
VLGLNPNFEYPSLQHSTTPVLHFLWSFFQNLIQPLAIVIEDFFVGWRIAFIGLPHGSGRRSGFLGFPADEFHDGVPVEPNHKCEKPDDERSKNKEKKAL